MEMEFKFFLIYWQVADLMNFFFGKNAMAMEELASDSTCHRINRTCYHHGRLSAMAHVITGA